MVYYLRWRIMVLFQIFCLFLHFFLQFIMQSCTTRGYRCVCAICYFCFVFVWCCSLQFNSLFCSDSIMHLFTEHGHICYRDVTFNDLPSWTMRSANTQTCKPQRIPHYRALKVTLLERLEKEYKNFWFWFNDLKQLCIYLDLRWYKSGDDDVDHLRWCQQMLVYWLLNVI